MPANFQEEPKPESEPNYSRLKREQPEKPLSTPEQAEVLESSEAVKEQITKMQEKIDQEIAENQNAINKRMESAINQAQTGELLPELPELQTQAEQELSNTLEQLTKLASNVKRKSREVAKEEEPCKAAERIVKQVFDVIHKFQDKETSGQTAVELSILGDRRQYLSKIEENLKTLTSPDYMDEKLTVAGPLEIIRSIIKAAGPNRMEEELKQAGPGALIQSISELGNHIITESDKKEIQNDLAELELTKEDVATAMANANKELNQFPNLEIYDSLIRALAEARILPKDSKTVNKTAKEIKRLQTKLGNKGISKTEQSQQIQQIIELKQQADLNQKSLEKTDDNVEYQESLLKERDQIEELIKIGAITEEEINELKQSFEQTTENLEQMIPKEIREQAEKDADEIQKQIEAMISRSSGSGYKAVLEAGVNNIRKLFKYHPEQSSTIKKAFVKAVELGLAAVAIFLVSHIAESGLFGTGEAEAAEQPSKNFDLHKEYPRLKEHLETGKLTLEETQALLREGFEDVEEGQLNIGDPDNPKIAEILLKAVIKQEYGIENIDIAKLPPNIQKFIQNESVNEYVEDALEDDLRETKEFIENNPEMKAWFEKTVGILKERLNALKNQAKEYLCVQQTDNTLKINKKAMDIYISSIASTDARYKLLINIDDKQKIEIVNNIHKIQQNAENVVFAMSAALNIADNPEIIKVFKLFTNPELMANLYVQGDTIDTEKRGIGGESYVQDSYFSLQFLDDSKGIPFFRYGEKTTQHKQGEITLMIARVQTFEELLSILIHELNHDLIQDDQAILIKWGRGSDYARIQEFLTDSLTHITLQYLKIEYEKIADLSADLKQYSEKLKSIHLDQGKILISYWEKLSRMLPAFEMAKTDLLAVYTGTKSPAECVAKMSKNFESWGLPSYEAQNLAQELIMMNSVKNETTAKIIEQVLNKYTNSAGHSKFVVTPYRDKTRIVEINKSNYHQWLAEKGGDLVLNIWEDSDVYFPNDTSYHIKYEIWNAILQGYSKQIEQRLKNNFTNNQIKHIMAGADINQEVKNLVNLIDWDKK